MVVLSQGLMLKSPPAWVAQVVSVSNSWPDGCEFDPQLRGLFFLAYFRLSPLQKHVRKVVSGFGKKLVVLVLGWESQETHVRRRMPWYDLNPFPNKPWFLRVCSTSLLKTLWEKEKLLVTSNFSFSHSVFNLFKELSFIFIKFEIVVCKLFQFGRV